MQDLLVLYATRMGSTREIAEVVAQECQAAGLSVAVYNAAAAPAPDSYRAVVLGSGVYLRRWRHDAVRYLRGHAAALRNCAVWLFQDGPCGEEAAVADTPVPFSVRRLARRVGAKPPTTFGGRLDPAHAQGVLSRWVATSSELRGDFRDWSVIRDWARGIAEELTAESGATGDEPAGLER